MEYRKAQIYAKKCNIPNILINKYFSQETISKLESEVIWLRAELDEMKQRKRNTLEVPIAAPTPAATNADIER